MQAAFDEHATELARNTQQKLDTAWAEFTKALDQTTACHRALMGAHTIDGFARGQGYGSGWVVTATTVAGHEVGVDVIWTSLRALVLHAQEQEERTP